MSPKKKDAIYKKNTLANVVKGRQQDNIARGFYGFQIFLLEYYQAVKKTYKIDYETYMCLFVILNHTIYELNKNRIYEDMQGLADDIMDTFKQKDFFKTRSKKITVTSISQSLDIPLETARRKIDNLIKKKLIIRSQEDGLKLTDKFLEVHKPFAYENVKRFGKVIRQLDHVGLIELLKADKVT